MQHKDIVSNVINCQNFTGTMIVLVIKSVYIHFGCPNAIFL